MQPNTIRHLLIIQLIFALCACSDNATSNHDRDNKLQYVKPEDVGYSSEKLEEARQFAEHSGFDAVIALYDGKVLFEWGNVSENYQLHSIRKPMLSALYGIHISEGTVNPNATMEQLGIDDIPPKLTATEKQATVRDLLMSRSGIYHEAAAEADIMIATRPLRGSHLPGTFFYYNNWDFNAAGTIFEQETGTKIFEEFEKRIAVLIGMEDFKAAECFYDYEPSKSNHPAYKFRMSARDLARFGVLYQNNGNWKGKQIIPTNWVWESTQAHSIEDSTLGIGYGYMWKVFLENSDLANLFDGQSFFGHTGLGGVQALIVIPAQKLVIVQRTNTDLPYEDKELGMELGLMIYHAKN